MKCVHCDAQNTDDAKHCRRCGAVLPPSTDVTAVLPLPNEANADPTDPLTEELGGTKPLHDTGPKSGPLYAQQSPASDTRPLQRARNFFEPLPERAIVNEGRCLIRSLEEESPLLNVYSAVSRRALVECRQCGFTRNNFGDQYCLQCWTSLA